MSDPGVNTWGRSPDTRGWLLQLSRAAACNVTSAWRALSGVSLSACSGLSVSGASVLAWLVRSRMCGTRRGRRKPDDATAGALESFGKATLHGQGRALAYTSRSLGRCGLVMEAPARMVAGRARRGGQQARGKLVYRARWRRWQESPAGVAGHPQVAGFGLGSRL